MADRSRELKALLKDMGKARRDLLREEDLSSLSIEELEANVRRINEQLFGPERVRINDDGDGTEPVH